MSLADNIFIKNCTDILEGGFWDNDFDVRPKWEDGTPAHTIKLFRIVNRYDLSRNSPY
jgi:thymidylate synthase